jgi:hypothetical protein
VDAAVLASAAELARASDVFRALAAREGRTLAPVPADAMPERASAAAAAAPADAAPQIQLRGWPNRLEIVKVPEGIRVDEDGHLKAFAWKASGRDVLADVSASPAGLGVRLRVKAGGVAAGGVPVTVSACNARKTYSTRPTDFTGEVVVRGMPLQSIRVDVGGVPVDIVIES